MNKLILKILLVTLLFQSGFFCASHSASYTDKPLTELQYWVNLASPGDIIKVADGIYSDITLNIRGMGTKENPVIVKAQSPGGVVITGDCHLNISGEYITFSGFYFKDANAVTSTELVGLNNAKGIRITDCVFERASGSGPSARVISISGNSPENRIDHCMFYDLKSIGIGIYPVDDPEGKLNNVRYNKIDNNYFKKVRAVKEIYPDKANGLECLQVGIGGDFALYTEVSYNLFEDCIGDGAEIISNKSSYNTYKFNTFLNNPSSTFCLRAGDNNIVYGNYFINMKDGVRAYGKNNIIANNYFYLIRRNSIVLSASDGKEYDTPKNCLVANNTIINPYYAGISIGEKLNENSINPPENIRVVNNYILSKSGKAIINKSGKNVSFENNIQRLNGGASSDSKPYFTDEYKQRKTLRAGHGFIKIRSFNNSGESAFNGEIFLPKNEADLKDKGIVIPGLLEIDTALPEDKTDIGVYGITKEEGKRGIITTDTAGPENKWWISICENLPGAYNKYEPEEQPVSYSPFTETVYLKKGAQFNINSIGGYAEYPDGSIYGVDYSKLQFSALKDSICELDKNVITAKNVGETSVDITYKGITRSVKIIVISENSSAVYDFSKDIEDFSKISGTISLDNGMIKLNPSSTAVSKRTYLTNSYSISADVVGAGARIAVGYNNNTNYGKLNGYNINGSYYYIEFGGATAGIYRYNGLSAFKEGDINAGISDNVIHNIRVDISGNRISAFADGVLCGVSEVADKIEGRAGLGSSSQTVKADNLKFEQIHTEEIEPKKAELTASVTGVNEITVNTINPNQEIQIYKLKRNGMYIGDFSKDAVIKDDKAVLAENYLYNLSGYDRYGNKVYTGECEITFDSIPDGVFHVSDVYVKCGDENSWKENTYTYSSDGIAIGSPVYNNRAYTYTDIPEELSGNPYIMTDYDHRKLNIAKNSSEWLKFSVNDSSFEVYVIVYSANPPQWITDGEWIKTDYTVSAETGSLKYEDAVVYKKVYSGEGGYTEVVLGGFGNASTYGIIIKNI